MTTEISTQEQFQEQMKARIRAAAGDLMPDEMLQEIVKRGIEEAFFKPAKRYDKYNRVIEGEPWLPTFLRSLMQEKVAVAVDAWLKENPEAVTKVLADVVKEGVGGTMIELLNRRTQYEFQQFADQLQRRLT
jgi:hypothetical protein